MSSSLTLETRLILACLQRDLDAERIQNLVKRGPDWRVILQGVERWALAPLVHTSLRQADPTGRVPDPVKERLRHLHRRETIHWIEQRDVLRDALQRFSDACVPVIVLKGAALATLVYPSPALQPARQVDLLVRQSDAARVEALLKSMRDAPVSLAAGAGAGQDMHRSFRRMSLLHVGTRILTHRHPADQLAAAHIPIENFWERARPVQIESAETLVFSPEDLLVHIAIDLVAGRFLGHAGMLCDLGQTCGRYRDAIDWSQLIAEARAYQIVKPLYYALRWARELVGAHVSPDALKELSRFKQMPLEGRLIAAGARHAILPHRGGTPIPSVARLAAHMLKHDRAKDGVRTGLRHLNRVCQRRLQQVRLWPEPQVLGAGVDFRAQASAIAIVLPIYRPRLNDKLLATVDRAIALLQHGDWHLVAPTSLDTSFYEKRYGKPIIRFPDTCLDSLQNYGRLLLTDGFYETFEQYEYILVIQDDVYVLRDDLTYWQARQLDYIGAPWPMGREHDLSMSRKPGIRWYTVTAYVGNGGFSLRRIAACRQLLAEFAEEAAWFRKHGGEDNFFACFGQFSQQFILPSLRVAAAFAWETSLPRMHALCEGKLPMAIHAYDKHDCEFFASTIQLSSSSGS
jgi:hypothetical protein